MRVFGSMSRGDASEASDVDLLVTLAPGTSVLGGLLLDGHQLLCRRVNIVTEASLRPGPRASVLGKRAMNPVLGRGGAV